MIKPYEIIDSIMIDWAERLSHRLQTWIGIDNFQIAKTLAKIATILPVFTYWIRFYDGEGLLFLIGMTILTSPICAINYLVFTRHIIKYNEDQVKHQASEGLVNKERLQSISDRFWIFGLVVCLVLFDALTGWSHGPIVFAIIWLAQIFLACTPLPPSESKIRQWVNGLKAWGKQPVVTPATSAS